MKTLKKSCSSKYLSSLVIFFFQLSEQYGPVRMLSQGKGNMLLIGTTRNTILQGSLDLKFSPIVQVFMFLFKCFRRCGS